MYCRELFVSNREFVAESYDLQYEETPRVENSRRMVSARRAYWQQYACLVAQIGFFLRCIILDGILLYYGGYAAMMDGPRTLARHYTLEGTFI
jgi:hypothetical protein